MSFTSVIKSNGFFWVSVLMVGIAVFNPQISVAQSEEDILNSIGNELDDESAKKKAAEKKEKEYKSVKVKADASYKSKRYGKAKEYYNQMLALKPDSDYANSRITLCDQKVAEAKAAEVLKQYQSKIKQADSYLASEKWAEANAKYKEAQSLQPDEVYPKTQISKIVKLEKEAKAAAAAAAIQKKYDATLATAEKALQAQSWDVAKSKFLEASEIKPSESYPREKAAEIVQLKAAAIAKAKALKQKKAYNEQVVKADQLFATRKWDASIAAYKLAQGIKADEAYPNNQIIKANARIKSDLDKKKKAEALESEFSMHKKKGEDALAKKNWLIAIQSFGAASALKPQNSDVLKLMASARSGKKAADDMALRQKAEAEAKVKTQKQFDSEMAIGTQAMASKKWDEARAAFNKAKILLPNESAPNNKLLELGKLIAKENAATAAADAKRKAEEQAEKAKKEAEAKAAAQAAAAEKARLAEEAKIAAEAAAAAETKRLADEAAEKARLDKEAKIAAEKKAVEEARLAEEAKVAAEKADAAEKERLTQLAAQKAQAEEEAKIAAEKATAEKEKLAKEAKLAAAAAAELKAQEEAQKRENEKIAQEKAAAQKAKADEEAKLAAIALAEKEAKAKAEASLQAEADKKRLEEEQLRKQKEFDQAVVEYNQAIKNSDWELALRAVNAAASFFPENSKISKMQSELAALQQAEKNALAAERQKEANKKAKEKAYQDVVSEGDKLLAAENYQEAKLKFEEALKFKSNEDYPKTQLSVIKERVLAKNAAALQKQQEIDAAFNENMSDGKDLMVSKDWDNAKSKFRKAQELKPESNLPQSKLVKIDELIQKEKEQAQQLANLETDYQDRMSNGNESLANNQFAEAKRFFFGASKLKPKEEAPKLKLKETENKWAEFIVAEKVAAAKQKAAELDANYNNSIVSGDQALSQEMWTEAINSYQSAIVLKPEEAYPKQKLSEAKKGKSDALAAAEKARAEKEAKLIAIEKERVRKQKLADEAAQLESDFGNYIKSGNEAMSSDNYKSAVKSYQKAVSLKPENSEATQKLALASEKYKAAEKIRFAKEKERRRLAQIELKKRQEKARIKREAYLAELNKNSPGELAKNYPDGITEEIDSENELVLTKSIIVENGEGRYLIRFDYPWGEHFYYLNGKKIRKDAYNWNVRKYKF